MLYSLNRDDLKQLHTADWSAEFRGAESFAAVFRTDANLLSTTLPRPLRSPENPVALAFVAKSPEPGFGSVNSEAELFVQATHRDRFHTATLPRKFVGRSWRLPAFLKHVFFKVDAVPDKCGWANDVKPPPCTEENSSDTKGRS